MPKDNDTEIAVIKAVMRQMEKLPVEARWRVLSYVQGRIAEPMLVAQMPTPPEPPEPLPPSVYGYGK